MEGAICIPLDVIVKARTEGDRRLVEVQASAETVDSEGDVILQKALLDSAGSFIRTGHLDIDHISELGLRLGIPDPESYIIGRPIEVKDLGDGRTGVVGEISRAKDGSFDPHRHRFDSFWQSLQSDPPVRWQSSVYGFPKSEMVEDCRQTECASGATRFLVKGIDWRSLAFTRNPINTSLKGYARIVTAKAFIDSFRKDMVMAPNQMSAGMPSPAGLPMPRNLDDLWGQYLRHIKDDCAFTGGANSSALFVQHFVNCCGMDRGSADLAAAALMYLVLRDQRRQVA